MNDGSCVRLRPEYSNHVWSYDFVHCRTDDGKAFRTLNILDEFSRECLAIRVQRKLDSLEVINALSDLFILRGVPAYIRSDNGPEFIAHDLSPDKRSSFQGAEHRRDVPEGRVGAFLVVIVLPCGKADAGLAECREERLVQELVPQPPVETFDEGVLGRLSGRDVVPADIAVLALAQDRHAGQLRSVIGDYGLWAASGGDDRVQFPRGALT